MKGINKIMMFNKIEKQLDGSYNLSEIVDTVNNIIDFLNNSYITRDSDTELSVIDIPHNTGVCKCPKCGSSYYEVTNSRMTCVAYTPIIKDGVNMNPDRNIHRSDARCVECGHEWVITNIGC